MAVSGWKLSIIGNINLFMHLSTRKAHVAIPFRDCVTENRSAAFTSTAIINVISKTDGLLSDLFVYLPDYAPEQ